MHENLNIIATLGSAFAVYWALRKPISKLEVELKEMRKEVHLLDSRIARIEGQLTPTQIHYWEPKVKEKE